MGEVNRKMAETTIELRHVLNMDNFKLFDFEYPCDDVKWKEELEQFIIDRFYFSEIGQETIDRFKHIFRVKMLAIMPYYNELYKTVMANTDPLLGYRQVENFTGNTKANEDRNEKLTATDYPQHDDPEEDIPTTAQNINAVNEQNTNNNYEKITEGFGGRSASELIKQYRENLLKINQMIADELKTCFMLVY